MFFDIADIDLTLYKLKSLKVVKWIKGWKIFSCFRGFPDKQTDVHMDKQTVVIVELQLKFK